MGIISNANMSKLLKTVYLTGVSNNKYQNSPVLSAIGKESWGGGKDIRYAAQYGDGGNFGSVYNMVTGINEGVNNLEWVAEQGYATGMFTINQPEMLTTAEDKGAYMKALSNKMAGCFDGMSKLMAMYLYGGKYGVIDTVVTAPSAALAASGNVMEIHSYGSIKMTKGTHFQFRQGSTVPALATLAAPVCTVTKKDGNKIYFDANVTGTTVSAGDIVVLYSAVGSDGKPRGFEGLADLIPSYGSRSGSDWESYIATDFRGVDRSEAVEELAGQFVEGETTGATKMTDAMVSLLKKTKRAGGLNNMMIVNDETWDAIGSELGIQRNLWQATDGAAAKQQGVTVGINELATAFGDAFIGRTVIDPYCTEGLVYSLEKDDLKFYDLGNVSRVINPVANDQMGKHEIESVGDQGFGNSFGTNVNIDKLFTVEQATAGEYGPEFRIAANVFGNYIMRKTTSAGVAVLH